MWKERVYRFKKSIKKQNIGEMLISRVNTYILCLFEFVGEG